MEHQEFELVTVKSGVKSLRSLSHGETFHPGIGPMIEAKILHVGQQRLIERCQGVSKFIIWDVGFGAAANVLAAIESLCNANISNANISHETEIEIHSFDRTTAPIEFALKNAEELAYILPHRDLLQALLVNKSVQIRPNIFWKLHLGDFRERVQSPGLPSPHSIFYDPYSLVGNPDMWTLEHFQFLWKCLDLDTPCLLTNYTRSTAIRATLLLAGFFVGNGCIIGEKAETTLAANQIQLLQQPLDGSWLNRVKNSTHAAPIRGQNSIKGPISVEDFELVRSHPQFRSLSQLN